MENNKPKISRTLNGPWSAILRGAYKPQPKRSDIQCPICKARFGNDGGLATHMLHKHKKYKAEKVSRIDFTKEYPKSPAKIPPKLEKLNEPTEEKVQESPKPKSQPERISVNRKRRIWRTNEQKWKILE